MKVTNSTQYHFECTKCGQCCSRPGVVMITPEELVTIANTLGVTIEFIQKMCLEFDGGYWQIEVADGDHCPFLENNQCSIHAVKPEQCRTYPFWPEIVETLDTWQAEASYCPGIGQGSSYSERQIRDLIRGNGSTN